MTRYLLIKKNRSIVKSVLLKEAYFKSIYIYFCESGQETSFPVFVLVGIWASTLLK